MWGGKMDSERGVFLLIASFLFLLYFCSTLLPESRVW